MKTFDWIVREATLAPAQATYEPPQLETVLNALETDGWEVFQILSLTVIRGDMFNRARVIARRPVKP